MNSCVFEICCKHMCNICMLQFEAKALVELSASDEVWEGEIFCVWCVCVFSSVSDSKTKHTICAM